MISGEMGTDMLTAVLWCTHGYLLSRYNNNVSYNLDRLSGFICIFCFHLGIVIICVSGSGYVLATSIAKL
jgi:hypothetical protein